MIFQVTRHTK